MAEQTMTIWFKLFGGFFYKTEEDGEWINVNEVLPRVIGKKASLFLEYLVINHKRVVSASELMELFWPEGVSDDPENALQQMLFKARTLLKKIAPGVRNPILSRSRQCLWSTELDIRLDLEQFDALYAEAKANGVENTDALLEVIDLYGSGIQLAGDYDWLEAVRIYYHTIYLDLCRMVMQPLQLDNRWIKILELTDRICELEPYADEFFVHMMQAHIMLGNQQTAIERYKSYREGLKREYDLTPSPEVERMYSLALQSETKSMDGQNLLQLFEQQEFSGALFCTFHVFVHLVLLERRNITRNGQSSSLVIFYVDQLQSGSVTDVHRMERVLRSGLRGGDAVTRLNATAFIVLLSGSATGTSEMVVQRIRKRFNAEFQQSAADIRWQVIELPTL